MTASPGSATEAPSPQGRILAATIAQIRRGGVREVRVQAVAAEAAVSTPLVYHYFGNRAGLVRAALAAAVADAPAPGAPADAPPRQRLVGLLVGPIGDTPKRREAAAMRNELAASALFDPELAELLAADTARREAAVVAALRTLAARGTDSATDAPESRPGDAHPAADEATAVARGLVGLADGLVERWLGGLLTADRVRALVARAVDAMVEP